MPSRLAASSRLVIVGQVMLAVQVDWDLFNRYREVMSPTTLLGVVITISVFSWLILRLRARFREDTGRDVDGLEMLTQFRDLRQQGELTEDEYRLIKSRLAGGSTPPAGATSVVAQKSAKPAAADVRQAECSEKAGETGQDDTSLRESRSTDEGPNLKSAETPRE